MTKLACPKCGSEEIEVDAEVWDDDTVSFIQHGGCLKCGAELEVVFKLDVVREVK